MFQLTEYIKEIRKGATSAEVAPEEALDRFLCNLALMNERFDGFDTKLNFRKMGQAWNALPSSERVAQRQKALKLLSTKE